MKTFVLFAMLTMAQGMASGGGGGLLEMIAIELSSFGFELLYSVIRMCKTCNSGTSPTTIPPISWSEWGACSVTCGEGVHVRRRSSEMEQKSCVLDQCPNPWSEWSECTLTCGGGVKTRFRGGTETVERQTVACAMNQCPFDPFEHDTCSCPPGRWSCLGQCQKGSSCQRIELDSDEMRCIGDNIGTCRAYGDPHINTFDGLKHDVYGVGNYTFAQLNSSTTMDKNLTWSIIMETAPVRAVSYASSWNITASSDDYVYSIFMNDNGLYHFDYAFTDNSIVTTRQFEQFVNFAKNGRQMRIRTSFGMVVQVDGINMQLKLPYAFHDKVEALCGNFNFDPSDDFKCPEGTVHSALGELKGASPSEFKTAQCWQINGESGPEGDVSVDVCDRSKCDHMFDHAVFAKCVEKVDPSSFIADCHVDYCLQPSNESLANIYDAFINQCKDFLPNDPSICSWQNTLGLDVEVGECHSWSEWSKCSVSCGGGTRSRLIEDKLESVTCNTHACPLDPAEQPSCSCGQGQWSCRGQCPAGQMCQRIELDSDEMHCLAVSLGKCGAYGDPHVWTYDGAKNDVYGIGNYTFTQFNTSFATHTNWLIVMETEAVGRVSQASAFTLNVTTDDYSYLVRTYKEAETTSISYMYNFKNGSIRSDIEFENFIQLKKNNEISYTTPFGIIVKQQKTRGEVFVPYAYMGKLEGICGNYDYNITDDYKCPNGTVWPFINDQSHSQTESEWKTAQCWKINGTDGPRPEDITICDDASVCDRLFDNDVFVKCLDKIDPTPFVSSCKMDYCQVPTNETLAEIMVAFMKQCADHSTDVCNWKDQLGLNECPAGMKWSGCKPQCEAFKSCSGLYECDNAILVEGCFCTDGTVFNNGTCVQSDECESIWSEWGQCSVSCGGGKRTRVGFVNAEKVSESRICNTHKCPFDPIKEDSCSCPTDQWSCQGDCSTGKSCQRIELDSKEMRCIDNSAGKCSAWGDPHVITYDGATNDVYGVANYTFTQFNSSFDFNTNWTVIMETAPTGQVSYATSFTLIVEAENMQYKIRTDHLANVVYSYNFTDLFIPTDEKFERYINLNRNVPGTVTYSTDFGVKLHHRGWNGEISVPYAYTGKLEGICGNYDYNVTDDFKCPDGTIWPYREFDGHQQTSSEFETAKCWKINGTDGPNPDNIKDQCNDDANRVCETLFDGEIFNECLSLIDSSVFIEACKVDYCLAPTNQTLEQIYDAFMSKCKDVLPNGDSVCSWKEKIGLHECPAGTSWSGCKPECEAQKACNGPDACDNNVLLAGCFCDEGTVFKNGTCVQPDQCQTYWAEWGSCSVSCGGGKRQRNGFQLAERVSESRLCNTQKCPFDPTEESVCSCPANQWSCQSNCPTGKSCQRVELDSKQMRCIDNNVGKCSAWGDPHVITYDGATNDVYGVANYTFTQFNASFDSDTNWTVIMETAPTGVVSYASSFTLIVDSEHFNYKIRTDEKAHVSYTYNFTDDLIVSDYEFEQLINLNRNVPGTVTYSTSFGVSMHHRGARGEIAVPYAYVGKLEGLCGNYDYNVTNDFKCPDGTIWPFQVQDGYKRTSSEWETAKCWKLNGTDGPNPDEILTDCGFDGVCENLFENDIFNECTKVVDPSSFVESCKVDYCLAPTNITLEQIYEAYMSMCKDVLPDNEGVCKWREETGLGECPSGMVWSGCKSQCEALKTCNGPDECSNNVLVEGCFCKVGTVFHNGACIQPNQCDAYWAEWSPCSLSCGGGRRTRSGYRDAEKTIDSRVCNTNKCPFDPIQEETCACPAGQWSCQGGCASGQTCQRVELNSTETRCIDNNVGKCSAWGDPHVITYDGATNDVYGVANYTFTQFNSSFDFDTNWTVIMETAPTGQVSYATSFTLIVETGNATYQIRTDEKANVAYSYNFKDSNNSITDLDFESFINLNRNNPGTITYTTDFGVKMHHRGWRGEISVPYAYKGKLEGLCGNYDYNVTDDFKCPNGTIWPFQLEDGYKQTSSEFETAKCWKINGTDGPNPDKISNDCDVADKCDRLFENDIFVNCTNAVDPTPFIESCKVDYCLVPTEETLDQIYAAFMGMCKDTLPNDEGVCTWRDVIGMDNCPFGTKWSGCERQCDAFSSCHDVNIECSNAILMEGCFCADGRVLNKHNQCVMPEQCYECTEFGSIESGITFDGNVIVNCHETAFGTQCDLICDGEVRYNNASIHQAICNDNYNSAQWMKLEVDDQGLPQQAFTIYPGNFYCADDSFSGDDSNGEELCNDIKQSYETSNNVIIQCSDETCVFDCPVGM